MKKDLEASAKIQLLGKLYQNLEASAKIQLLGKLYQNRRTLRLVLRSSYWVSCIKTWRRTLRPVLRSSY